jgi:hypothetical protein
VGLSKVLLVPDVHVPYHDVRAWDLMLRAGAVLKPTHVVVLGDMLDCAAISAHSKDPTRIARFKEEVAAGRKALEQLSALGARKKMFVEGNHEFRLPRYLRDHAPELVDMVSLPDLLRLKETGWQYVPYRSYAKVGLLHVTHETGHAGANAHVKALNDFQDNVAIGHVHRMGITYAGNAKGKPHVGASFGWLGDVKQIDYMHRVKANRDWMLGFGIGYLESSGVIHLQAVPIIDYKCVVEGRLVT